jgi:hypothetical protein
MRGRIAEAAAQFVAVALTVWLSPWVDADRVWALVVAAALVAVAAWLLRPALTALARRFGWVGAVLTSLFAQAVILGVALYFTPGITVDGPLGLIVTSWIYGAVAAVVMWLFAVSGDEYLIDYAVRQAAKRQAPLTDSAEGVLFIQLDGLPAPVLEYELHAGNLPTIGSWLRSGSHTWTEWTARVPSTTPVSQAGILHGSNDGIPAFRWYDRELGRMLVANRPADATVIEARVSNGRGLLADDGVSISNLFSGDASTSRLTMSALGAEQRDVGSPSDFATFLTHPAGLTRGLTLTLGEMLKEVFQARRQQRRAVEPRVHRGGAYVALRGITNVLLRDLNVALTVEAMMRGNKAIYVDFVDYDEIAHHAGVTRPESLASLHGLDQVVGSLDKLARSGRTPRPYRIVLVSDHGQSQGATFKTRYGTSLAELVSAHAAGTASPPAPDEAEARGRVHAFVLGMGQKSVAGRLASKAGPQPDVAAGPGEAPPLAVVGSGNLGAVWFTDSDERLTLSQLESRFPGLIEALATHPGVGFVVVLGATGPVAIGARGAVNLATGDVTGEDPLGGWPEQTREDFVRVSAFTNAPDIYLNSLYDPALGEVAAFEELVGCHGGLGGWQTRPMLVHPADWTVDEDLVGASGLLHGADNVHRQFVRWLEGLGHRADLASMDPTSRV